MPSVRGAIGLVALVLGLVLAGCGDGGRASEATIRSSGRVSGRSAELVLGARRMRLPDGDVGGGAGQVVEDANGRRLAYPAAQGTDRIAYLVGDAIFLGPRVAHPVDFRAVPSTDHALGPLFELAGPRRSELVREVERERGLGGLARLLIDTAWIDDPAWDEARGRLSDDGVVALGDGLGGALEAGQSPVVLRHALSALDLTPKWRTKIVAARAADPAVARVEPRAAAVLLRALTLKDSRTAGAIGCDVLARSGRRDPALIEAATVAVASAEASCPELVEAVLAGDACSPAFRCDEGGPLRADAQGKPDAPMCTREQLARAVGAELGRSAVDVLAEKDSRPELFALAALARADRVPAAFALAQATACRRAPSRTGASDAAP